jgi:hypothetical protein
MGACRQGVSRRVRVHIVSPMRDPPVSKLDDRAEPIFILGARREDRPMEVVLDHDDPAVVRSVDDQHVCGVEPDAADSRPSSGSPRPV